MIIESKFDLVVLKTIRLRLKMVCHVFQISLVNLLRNLSCDLSWTTIEKFNFFDINITQNSFSSNISCINTSYI